MTQELQLTAEIPYHEGETARIDIDNRKSEDSPIVNLETYNGNVNFTLDELREIVTIAERFERAEAIFRETEKKE